MDTTEITHVSLCSGYGGIDLGLRRCIPLRTVAYAEIEAFACELLLARMEGGQIDAAPIWTDLKSFPWAEFSGRVDILSGGYPCQPFSAAGKRAGKDDPRHLWPYIADGIRLLRPRACFFENVEGHVSLGLSSVISDLEELGYAVSWGIFSASECGAPHQRKRVFILAVAGGLGGAARFSGQITWHEGITGITDDHSGEIVANSGHEQPQGRDKTPERQQSGTGGIPWSELASRHEQVWPSRPGQPQHFWEPPRVVANAKGQRASSGRELCGEECRQGRALPCELVEPGQSMGNATEQGCKRSGRPNDSRRQVNGSAESDGSGANWCMEQEQRQVEPALGGDAHGPPCGLGYAELYVTCDNRTDELRLLGNGVVPATAALAFKTLFNQLWAK